MDTATRRGLEVYLLGPLRVVVDGRELDVAAWKSKRAVTLFKYLITRCGERVPRDVLVELLWPDSDDGDKSTHNLHTVIYYLRRTLEPGLGRYQEQRFLRQAHGLYWIEPGAPVWTDAEEFRWLVRRADGLRHRDPVEALELYRRALALYRDDFCSEDLYEDWAVTVRERFREMYFAAALQAAQLMVDIENDVAGAVDVCRAALAREPYREELHQAIIGFFIRAGRYGEAARQYRACERLLYEEFGLAPSPETQALFESMKTVRAAERVEDDPRRPFVCDRSTYAAIFRLDLRRLARTGESIGLLRVSLGDGPLGPAERGRVEARLAGVIRQGDVVCWESPQRLVVHLSRARAEHVAAVRGRIRRALEELGLSSVFIEDSIVRPDARPAAVREGILSGSVETM